MFFAAAIRIQRVRKSRPSYMPIGVSSLIRKLNKIQVDRREALGKTELLAALALTENPLVRKLMNSSWVQKIDFSD